jgi:hypothetical protein
MLYKNKNKTFKIHRKLRRNLLGNRAFVAYRE